MAPILIERWVRASPEYRARVGGSVTRRLGAGCGHHTKKMLLKITLALALGSLGMLILHRLRESEDEVALERKVEAQLQALREHLFQR